MLTQCPSCQTTFRVTSEILRVAQGQVRCGRCQTQFDALARLIEEAPPGHVETARFLRPVSPPAAEPEPEEFPIDIEVEEPEEQEEITLEGRHIEITGTYRVADEDELGTGTHLKQESTEEWVEFDENDEVGAVDVPAGEIADEDTPQESLDSFQEEPAAEPIVAYRDAAGTGAYRDLADFDDDATSAAAARALPQDPLFVNPRRFPGGRRVLLSENLADDAEDFSMVTAGGHGRPRRTALKWKLLAAPLVILLLVQIVHHYRSDLARHPQVGASLMSLYNSVRLPLTPEWNLHAYEIKQWGVLSDPAHPGTLKVRASITNRAAFAQPYPLLKLVLEDRWGDQVRAREFEPAEYLDPGSAADRMLGPQQQVNATINIVDPGPDAEGFRFDVCLVGRAGPVCGAEVPE